MRSSCAEAGPDNVRVNCIQPGVVEGERIDRVIAAKAPLRAMFGYSTDLRSRSQGRATFTMKFDSYDAWT